MSERILATFDVGGTHMRADTIAVTGTGWRTLDQLRRPTPSYLSASDLPATERLDDLQNFVTEYANTARTRFGANALAAAFPGPVQGRGACLHYPPCGGPTAQRFARWISLPVLQRACRTLKSE